MNPCLIDLEDIISVGFNISNGQSFVFPAKELGLFWMNLIDVNLTPNDRIFKMNFTFDQVIICVDKNYVLKMIKIGFYNSIKNNNIDMIVLHFNNDYKIKSNIPMMLCYSAPDTKLECTESGNSFTIKLCSASDMDRF